MFYYGLEWQSLASYFQFREIAAPDTPQSNEIRLYAKDSSGVSTLCYKNDAGSEICLPTTAGVIPTGAGVANRMTYWDTATTLSANAALTATNVVFASATGLLSGSDNLRWSAASITNGALSVGINVASAALHVVGVSNQSLIGNSGVLLDNYSGAAAPGNGALLQRAARGATASPTAIQTDDIIGGFASRVFHSGGVFGTTGIAQVFAKAGENATSTAQGSYIQFNTTPTGSITVAERFRVGPAGQWGIGGATFGSSGQFFTSGGASAAPSWTTHNSTGDPHTQYALLAGRIGGQTLIGGTAAADDLILKATSGNGVGSEVIQFLIGNNGAKLSQISQLHSNAALGIGFAPIAVISGLNTSDSHEAFEVVGDGANANIAAAMFIASANGPGINFTKGRGTYSSPGQTLSGDTIFGISAFPMDNSGPPAIERGPTCSIVGRTTENIVSTTNWGSDISFYFVPNGSAAQTRALWLSTAGHVLGDTGRTLDLKATTTQVTGLLGIGVVPTNLLHLLYTGSGTRAFTVEGDGVAANASFESYVNSVAASTFIFRKGRGTKASPTQALSGDALFAIVTRSIDNTNALTGDMAKIASSATENITTTGHGSDFQISVVPNGSTTQRLSWSFSQNGDFVAQYNAAKIDLSAISAGNPNFKITATSNTPTVTWGAVTETIKVSVAPQGYLEINDGSGTPGYIPYFR